MSEEDSELPYELFETGVKKIGNVPIVKGDFNSLPRRVQIFITHYVHLCGPRGIYICDGSKEEADEIALKLLERGTLTRLTKYRNNHLYRTDPDDIALLESRTYICTRNKYDSVPHVREGVSGIMGTWLSPEQAKEELDHRFPGCMRGRMMYVIPFSMGPVGSPFSKIGVQVTDSIYVVLCMRIMTRVMPKVWKVLGRNKFVECVHSIGCPRPIQKRLKNHWPCNLAKAMIVHFPEERKIKSFGSGYGGNALLGKKCFSLRIAGVIAQDEGWMAEHMLIISITTPKGNEHFVAAAFPSTCGRTNLAMLNPSLPGFKVQCVGHDIAWMRFDANGVLHGINPEAGFFCFAPGTSMKTNPNVVMSLQSNSIFLNVAETTDGGYYWEGLENEIPKDVGVIDWLGNPWHPGCQGKAAHPKSRFASPASQCPIMHPQWENPKGVPISAIIFGGRRPVGVPLVFEAKSWAHGVMIGACIKSEVTPAAGHHGKHIMHDPMAMRPYMGYNFGHYLQHWLDLDRPERKMPKIFHVNWFRVDHEGKFLWPGFGDNIRVLDWIIKRCEGDNSIARETPIGYLPKKVTIDMSGMGPVNEDELFSLPKTYWQEDTKESKKFLEDQCGSDTPPILIKLLNKQEEEIGNLVSENVGQEPCMNPPLVNRCFSSLAKAQQLNPL